MENQFENKIQNMVAQSTAVETSFANIDSYDLINNIYNNQVVSTSLAYPNKYAKFPNSPSNLMGMCITMNMSRIQI